jgi:hypothetical protein
MNGRAWRIAIYRVMLAVGEDGTTGELVAETANRLFPSMQYRAVVLEAQWELSQFRKHLAFLREPHMGAAAPSIEQLLKWALKFPGNRRLPGQTADLAAIRQEIGYKVRAKEREEPDVRQPLATQPNAALRPTAPIQT